MPLKRFGSVCLLAALVVLASPSVAATSARARLDTFAHNLHSLSGHFRQTLINNDGSHGKTTHGTVALEAPRLFRWQTTSPYKQLIVADGHKVWMYEPDLDQVTVRKQSTAEAHSPLTVLTDVKRLDADFHVKEMGMRDGLAWLRLTPRDKQGRFGYVELGFDQSGLRAMVFKDQLDNITRMRFSHWKRNVDLPASTFRFTPPKGADVINQTESGAQVHPLQH